MLKKVIPPLFTVFLLGLFLLPNLALADGSYQIQKFKDANENGIFDYDAKKNPQEQEDGSPTTVCYEGFVPCGKQVRINGLVGGKCPAKITENNVEKLVAETKLPVHCQLCHFFVMVDGAIDYVVVQLVPILAVLMLVIAGIMYYFGGTNPGLLGRAKTLIKGVVIGLFLIYGAYMIVNIFLTVLGAAEINSIQQVFKNGVFSIKCPVYAPSSVF